MPFRPPPLSPSQKRLLETGYLWPGATMSYIGLNEGTDWFCSTVQIRRAITGMISLEPEGLPGGMSDHSLLPAVGQI